jgi:hypothetical protein
VAAVIRSGAFREAAAAVGVSAQRAQQVEVLVLTRLQQALRR